MKVKTTKDYEKFKSIIGNRNIVLPHIKKLVATIKSDNLTEYVPILVNEKMEVIDGQHRLSALQELGLPVKYVVLDGADLATVQMLNSSSRSWSLKDYVESYASRGNENYIILSEYIRKYDLPISVCVPLLVGGEGRGNGDLVRSGNLVVKYESFANAIGTYMSFIRQYVDKAIFRNRDFLRACVKILKSDVNRKQLLRKLKLFGSLIKPQVSREDYLREFERIYNYRRRGEHVRLF